MSGIAGGTAGRAISIAGTICVGISGLLVLSGLYLIPQFP